MNMHHRIVLLSLVVPALFACSTDAKPSPSALLSSENPFSTYKPRGELFLFMDLYEEGFFSHQEVKDIAYRNNNDWLIKRGVKEDYLPAGGTIIPRPAKEIEQAICDDYYYDYITHEGKYDIEKGAVIERDSFEIASYCGEFRGYYVFRFEECRTYGFPAVVDVYLEGVCIEYQYRCGEVLRAWKPIAE